MPLPQYHACMSHTSNRTQDIIEDWGSYHDAYTSEGVRKVEKAVEYFLPDFPMNNLNSWYLLLALSAQQYLNGALVCRFVEHYDTFHQSVNRASLFFSMLNAASGNYLIADSIIERALTPFSVALLVIAMIVSILAYLSLVYSPAREDTTGKAVEVLSML